MVVPDMVKRTGLSTLLAAATSLLVACSSDLPTNGVTWDLTVVNNTADNLDIFQRTTADVTSDFEQVGEVDGNSLAVVRFRNISVEYTFRLVSRGLPADSVTFEKTLMSTGPDQIWTVP